MLLLRALVRISHHLFKRGLVFGAVQAKHPCHGLQDLIAVVHPIVTLRNAGQIDRHDKFEYYHQVEFVSSIILPKC